jgi:integrase
MPINENHASAMKPLCPQSFPLKYDRQLRQHRWNELGSGQPYERYLNGWILPRWGIMKRHIRPVATEVGIHKNTGWHTFRHTFGTLLKANGEDVKTVQELLWHANSRITLDVYTQAVTSNKRAAESKVIRMMVSDVRQKREEKYPQAVQ